MTKEEAWKAATKRSTRGSLSKEEKENSAELESQMSEESRAGKHKKEPLRDIKKRLENRTFVKVTPVKGKKMKLKNKNARKSTRRCARFTCIDCIQCIDCID